MKSYKLAINFWDEEIKWPPKEQIGDFLIILMLRWEDIYYLSQHINFYMKTFRKSLDWKYKFKRKIFL